MKKPDLEAYVRTLRKNALTTDDEELGIASASPRLLDLGCRIAALVEDAVNTDVEAHGQLRNDEVASMIVSAAIGLALFRCGMPETWVRQAFTNMIAKYVELNSVGMLSPSASKLSH